MTARHVVPWLAAPLLALALGWAALALWLDGPASRPVAGALAAGLLLAALGALVFLRPWRRAWASIAMLFLAVLGWWLLLAPRNDRDWQPDVARLATAEIDGDRVTIHNVRDFDYRSESDFTEHWEERSFDLSSVRGVDLFLSFWGPTLIAHTIASFELADGRHLAISIETRKEKGESYSALRGFFRQYELYYVVADERDLVGVRANHRGERVFLYRLRATPEFAQALLRSYVSDINRLAEHPDWYNAATHNCTTTIRSLIQQANVHNPWDWRILVNGKLDEALYERGNIDTSEPLATVRARSEVTEHAKAAGGAPDFAQRIRDGLPPRPPAGSR